jgi:hypothetical protein
MKAADVIWTEDTLRAFLLDPRSFVPANKMVASGIKREDVLGPLIAYLLEVAKPATD